MYFTSQITGLSAVISMRSFTLSLMFDTSSYPLHYEEWLKNQKNTNKERPRNKGGSYLKSIQLFPVCCYANIPLLCFCPLMTEILPLVTLLGKSNGGTSWLDRLGQVSHTNKNHNRNNCSSYWNSIYCVPGPVPRTSLVLTHLILTMTQWKSYSYPLEGWGW